MSLIVVFAYNAYSWGGVSQWLKSELVTKLFSFLFFGGVEPHNSQSMNYYHYGLEQDLTSYCFREIVPLLNVL